MKNSVESLGRIRAKGIALLAVTFMVGALAGMAAERLRPRPSPFPEVPPGMMSQGKPGAMPPMFGELNLTPEQREQILQIMERSRPRTEDVLGEMMPRLQAVTASVRDEIHAVLTPEQVAKLDSLTTDMRARRGWMRRGMRGHGQGEPPPRGRRPFQERGQERP
jgi:Spy/CpxP family protein refolding chaperone